jgi:hypothetical protein
MAIMQLNLAVSLNANFSVKIKTVLIVRMEVGVSYNKDVRMCIPLIKSPIHCLNER